MLVTQVLDPLSKTLGPDVFWNSESFQILESLRGAYMIDDLTPTPTKVKAWNTLTALSKAQTSQEG